MNHSYITSISTANPPHRFDQMKVAEFMIKTQNMNEAESRQLRAIYRASGIKSRYSSIPDFGNEVEDYQFFPPNQSAEPFPSTSHRMDHFNQHALPVSLQAAKNCLKNKDLRQITHLITISCTGMNAPGLDIQLVEALELSFSVQRTAVNFMGCYAAFNALKLADAIVRADPQAQVLIVGTEFCTLHFHKEKDENNLLANALFGDGSAAVLVEGKPGPGTSLRMQQFFCDLAPVGKQEMAWKIGDHGFEMKLTRKVPDVIKLGIKQLYINLLNSLEDQVNQIDFYAIHPGGKKILKVIEEELELSSHDNRWAYQVLAENGNMSSVTVLFVLKSIMEHLQESDHNKNILSFAFGPGLTLESMLLNIHHA